ncbi:hypothetical protein [Flavobacterium sp.]|jgi:hypothetical protein|uniref:hypothetical protein n=1 Tax=Flavobacterium sp. TaxID=239 RepID=UPI0025C27AFB|nr:hypothetical protein [Flavobacterium sp.]
MKQLCILLIFILSSCGNIKTTYVKGELDQNHYGEKQIFEKFNAGSNDKSVIVLTSGFENDSIRILSGKNIVFKESVTTNESTGLAIFNVISNEEKAEVEILTGNLVKISLKQNDLKKYKLIYISKSVFKKDKYKLEYSNKWKQFR